MIVMVEIESPNHDECAFGTARAAINWVKGHTDRALIKLDGHIAYKYDHGKLMWNNGTSFESLEA